MDSLRFMYPDLLWLLLILPVLAFLRGRRGPAPALVFSSISVAKAISGSRKVSPGRFLAWLRLAALGLIIVAIARPQWGNSKTEVEASGIDILLAVDVSGSMQAMDFQLKDRAVDRLTVVKAVVKKFIEERPNDRIGLVAFAGRPYMVCPLTLDHDWLQLRLDSLATGMIEDGTAIGSAIVAGVNRLQEQEAKSRIVILLTDGVNNSGKAAPLTAAEAAETMKIKVYTIGAGKQGWAKIPVKNMFGRMELRNVMVDIDEKTLGRIAEMTGAKYFRATDTQSLEKIYEEINAMETTTRQIKHFDRYRELFSWLVFAALGMLGAEFFLSRRRLP